jgi:hypothetical protein
MKRLVIIAVLLLAVAVAGAAPTADASHKGKPKHHKRWTKRHVTSAMVGTPVLCSYDPATGAFDPPGCAQPPLPPDFPPLP